MMQREDSKRMQEMADDSRRIARASLRDSNEMRHLAADTKKLAEDTRLDSSSMRTIAIVTMLFLPGTAIAVSRSATHWFYLEKGADIIGRPFSVWAHSSI